jgi:hypothetical protein
MIAAERYTRSRCAESDRLSLPVIGDYALILVGTMISDAALRNLCISCKSLSPGSRGRGIGRKELLGHRTDVLDDLTALINTVAVKIFASAEKLMLESYLHHYYSQVSEHDILEEPSVGYRFENLYDTLRPEELRKLHKEFIQGVAVPAEEGLRALGAYTEDCAIVGPAVHLQVKGSCCLRVKGSCCMPLSVLRCATSVVVGLQTLQDEDSFKGFLQAVFIHIRPELLSESRGRPTWTKSLAIIEGGGTCSSEAEDNTTKLLYSGLVFPLSSIMDQDQIPLDIEQQARPCWCTISTPGHPPEQGWYV